MANVRKPARDRAADPRRPGFAVVNLRVPDDLLAAVDARVDTLNAERGPGAPPWSRTGVVLSALAEAAKGWTAEAPAKPAKGAK